MEIREINDKKIWEDFFLNIKRKTFLQSWNWGEFQESLGNKIWRWGIFDGNELVSAVLVIKHVAKRGSFLLVPHGPVVVENEASNKKQALEILLNRLKELAKDEKVSFIRICSIFERTEENNNLFQKLGFRKAPFHSHPEASWKLDISFSEDKLLENMRKTTRYLIKQAEKNQDVEIIEAGSIEDVEIFNKLHLEVVKNQRFVPFSLEYFKKEFNYFNQDNQVSILFAKYKGEFVAAAYVVFWSNIAFYHHAALLPKYRRLPLAYLLQWKAIKSAKKRNCKLYDFWGYVDPQIYPKHPWAGPTLFKMGFSGFKDEYVKTKDLIISQKYWLNYIIEIIRKTKRGL